MTMCPCGQELHYVSDQVRENVEAAVLEHGETTEMRVGGELVAVPRHFVALHSPVTPAAVRRHGFEVVQ